MFKEGQKVWCSAWGWGKVVEVEDGDDYSVSVDFSSGDSSWFTKEGKLEDTAPRCLFFDEVIPDRKALTPPIVYPGLVRGDAVVLVDNSVKVVLENSPSVEKHFAASDKLPRVLEDAYNGQIFNKEDIKKVLGNIND